MKGAIERICGISSIRVRRKTSINSRGGRRWWFMLHDDEGVLCSLESQWSSIELQTAWKLEPCFMQQVSVQNSQNSQASGVLPSNGDDDSSKADNRVQEQQLVEVGTSETKEDSSVTLQSQRELVDEIMNHNLTQGPHNATSADLPPSSEPVVHDSSGLGLPTVPSSVTATRSNVDSAALHSASPPPCAT